MPVELPAHADGEVAAAVFGTHVARVSASALAREHGWRFTELDPMHVIVVLAPRTAHLAAVQHTAWMLVNLLARATGVVDTVRVICPTDVPLAGRIVPLASRDLALADALVTGGQAIGAAHDGGRDAVRALAVDAGVDEADVQRWLARGGCDEVSARLLATLRRNEPEPPTRFAVGFTSAMAGVLLATETIKTLLSRPMAPDSIRGQQRHLPVLQANCSSQLCRTART